VNPLTRTSLSPRLYSKLSLYIHIFIDILLIFFFAAIPFLRIGLDGVIRPLDSDFPLYPLEYYTRLSLWFETGAFFGNDGSFTSLAFRPFYFLPALLSLFGIPINIVNRVILILFFALLGLSAYIMVNILIPQRHRFAPLLSAFFYMYNPFIMGYLNLGHWYSLLTFAILPVFVLSFVKGLDQKSQWPKWALLTAVLSIFLIPRVRIFPIFIQFLSIYLILYFIKNRSFSHALQAVKFILLTIFTIIILNLSWILPSLVNFGSMFELLTTPSVITSKSFDYPSSFNSIFNILNLVGYGIPMNKEYGLFYETPLVRFVSLFILILIYLSILLRPKDLTVIFFTLSSLFFTLFMIMIIKIPFFMNLYLRVRAFVPLPLNLLFFPTSFHYTSLPIVLSYAFLLNSTFNDLIQRSKNIKISLIMRKKRNRTSFLHKEIRSKIFITLIILSILVNSWPLFAGVNKDFLSPIHVPSYYDESRQWLSNQKLDFRILAIPHPYWLHFMKHPWAFDGKRDITDILLQVSPVPVIAAKPKFGYSKGSEIINIAYSAVSNISGQKILDLLGVKYILVRHDVLHDQLNYYTSLEDIFTLEKSIGELDFFRNPTYAPIVSAASVALPIYGKVDALIPLTYLKELDFNSTAFFFINEMNEEDKLFLVNSCKRLLVFDQDFNDQTLLQVIDKKDVDVYFLFNSAFPSSIKVLKDGLYTLTTIERISLQESSSILNLSKDSTFLSLHARARAPRVSILSPIESSLMNSNRVELNTTKNSHVSYTIDVYSEAPFFLVLNMLYNPKWSAFLNGQELRHLETNSYANGYYVPETGRFSIELIYPGQQLLDIGTYISTIFFMIIVLYITGIYKSLNFRIPHFTRGRKDFFRSSFISFFKNLKKILLPKRC